MLYVSQPASPDISEEKATHLVNEHLVQHPGCKSTPAKTPGGKDTLLPWLHLSDSCGIRKQAQRQADVLRKINEDVKVTDDTWLVSKPQ